MLGAPGDRGRHRAENLYGPTEQEKTEVPDRLVEWVLPFHIFEAALRWTSIVTIHGIGANPDDTWCKLVGKDESGLRYINWLKDATSSRSKCPKHLIWLQISVVWRQRCTSKLISPRFTSMRS